MKLLFVFLMTINMAWAANVPQKFNVIFKTSKGEFTLAIDQKNAPLGVERFYELVQKKYYNNAKFFRVVKGFVVQFGIAADPKDSKKWSNANIKDDPVLLSNTEGTISFATAGPNTRTTQLFINLGDNSNLDRMGFAAFGKVEKGMDVVKALYGEYGEEPTPEQGSIERLGNKFLDAKYPKLDYIIDAKIVVVK